MHVVSGFWRRIVDICMHVIFVKKIFSNLVQPTCYLVHNSLGKCEKNMQEEKEIYVEKICLSWFLWRRKKKGFNRLHLSVHTRFWLRLHIVLRRRKNMKMLFFTIFRCAPCATFSEYYVYFVYLPTFLSVQDQSYSLTIRGYRTLF